MEGVEKPQYNQWTAQLEFSGGTTPQSLPIMSRLLIRHAPHSLEEKLP